MAVQLQDVSAGGVAPQHGGVVEGVDCPALLLALHGAPPPTVALLAGLVRQTVESVALQAVDPRPAAGRLQLGLLHLLHREDRDLVYVGDRHAPPGALVLPHALSGGGDWGAGPQHGVSSVSVGAGVWSPDLGLLGVPHHHFTAGVRRGGPASLSRHLTLVAGPGLARAAALGGGELGVGPGPGLGLGDPLEVVDVLLLPPGLHTQRLVRPRRWRRGTLLLVLLVELGDDVHDGPGGGPVEGEAGRVEVLVTEVERVEAGRWPTVPSWEYLTLGEVLQEELGSADGLTDRRGQLGSVLVDEHRLGLLDQVRLSPGVSGGRFSLKLNFFPRLSGDRGLELCPAAVTESRAKSEEALLDPGWSARSSQSEESVVLHSAFPETFASFLTRQPANIAG